ncbi:unnamed protein product, partial [Mesorhabditis spiculigera]
MGLKLLLGAIRPASVALGDIRIGRNVKAATRSALETCSRSQGQRKPGDRVVGVKTYYDREGFLSLPYLVSYESPNEPPNAAETASSLARLFRKIAKGACVACSSLELKHNKGILRCCRRCADKIERWTGEKNRCPTQCPDSAKLADPSADLLGGCTECLARRLHSFGFVLPAHIAAILHIYPKKRLLGGAICKHQRYSLLPLF